ncbi:MAG: PEP-utilizing enzyme, partial [Filifactor alocis]|nr:PEP-utilizing enzyme [Filifactor alocis]
LQEDSTFLFQTLKNYLKMEGKVPVYQIEEVDEGELYRQVSFLEKQLLKVLVGITKYFVRNRELLRLRRTYIYAIVRNIFLRFGHNFEARGILEHYRDVFFLTKDEVFSLAEGKDFDVRERIEQRKEEYETNKEKKIYERMYFYGEVAEETMIPIFSRQEILEHDETMLYGVAGGGGVVEGRVKYVTDPADADVDGYILMAQRTDPGWTVLFPMAKAVIIERGSVLSHSAVIAREMGLTLVVGVRGLTDRVKDGMKVRVDGIRGSIELMEEE